MRQKSMIATAAVALLAGTVLASAQGMQKQAPGGGAAEHGMQQDHSSGAAQNSGEEGKGQRKQNRAQGSQKENSTVGQGQGQQSEPKAKGSEPKAQHSQEGKQPKTSGQGQQSEPKANGSEPKAQRSQEGKQPSTSGQGQQSSPKANSKDERGPNAREGQQGQQKSEPGRTQGQRTGAGAAVTLTTEQRTKIRETVIRGSNAPRVTKVDFSISVGTAVPRTVKVVTVPQVIIDIHPEWRGYYYFVYEEEVIIVDKDHKIIAVIEV